MVYLIGAGPGHPGLITRLGYSLLQHCDIVVYDDLTPLELITDLPNRIERYYVGKRSGEHSVPQGETNRLLVNLARKGNVIVRLKGGDPMIFGRGGEEMDYLRDALVPVVVVPGVTATSAAAAGAGIPLTDRRAASWLMFATGHSASSDSPEVPWDTIANMDGGTIVVYMGIKEMKKITDQLIEGGASPYTHAAVISNAYSGAQHVIYAPLSELVDRCQEQGVETPALIIIGNAVKWGEAMGEMRPGALTGKRVLVTRPAGQVGRICRLLRQHGAEPIPLPTIALEKADDPQGWERFAKVKEEGGWCVFTSEGAVNHFIDRLLVEGYDLRAFGRFRIAAVGEGTKRALSKLLLSVDLVPEIATVKELARKLTEEAWLLRVNVVRVRGDRSDDTLEESVREANGRVLPLTVYNNRFAEWDPIWIKKIKKNPPDYIIFTSGSTVEGFIHVLGETEAIRIAHLSKVVVIGPSTAEVAELLGLKVDIQAETHNVEGIVKAMVDQG